MFLFFYCKGYPWQGVLAFLCGLSQPQACDLQR